MNKAKLQNSPQAGDADPLGEPGQLFILSETSPVFWQGRKAEFPPLEESEEAWRCPQMQTRVEFISSH